MDSDNFFEPALLPSDYEGTALAGMYGECGTCAYFSVRFPRLIGKFGFKTNQTERLFLKEYAKFIEHFNKEHVDNGQTRTKGKKKRRNTRRDTREQVSGQHLLGFSPQVSRFFVSSRGAPTVTATENIDDAIGVATSNAAAGEPVWVSLGTCTIPEYPNPAPEPEQGDVFHIAMTDDTIIGYYLGDGPDGTIRVGPKPEEDQNTS